MIPDHLIDQAARAMKASVSDDEWRNDVWDAPYVNNARAALEAVAADIWDEGNLAGCDRSENHDNPYRNERA